MTQASDHIDRVGRALRLKKARRWTHGSGEQSTSAVQRANDWGMRNQTITRGAFLLASSIALAQCGPPQETYTTPTEATAPQPSDPAAAARADKLPAADMARVCRATVAALNDLDPDVVKVSGNSGELVQVRYVDASDGEVWTNECRVIGNRVILRTIEAFGPQSGKGRWRTAPMDEIITYKIEGPEVSVTTRYSETSSSTETFTLPN